VPDQVIGDLAEMLGGQHSIGELIKHVGVRLLDGVDQVVEAEGVRNGCRLSHVVNSRLTNPRSSTVG
jgi:hypothetical protein